MASHLRPILLALVGATLTASCTPGPAQPSSPAPLAASAASTAASAPPPTVEIRGSAVGVRSYCGGAPPTRQILDELRTPRPEAGLPLVFRRGDTNTPGGPIEAETRTDASGHFVVRLPPGSYCVVDGAKRDDHAPPASGPVTPDPVCYRRWLRTCDTGLQVSHEPGQPVLTFERGCGDPVCVPVQPRP